MADLIKIVIYVIVTLTYSVLTQDTPRPIIDVCKQISPCSCQYSNGVIVDLSSLSSNDSANPKFKDISSEIVGGAKYSWNPCSPFTEGVGCNNVTLCEIIAGAPTPKYVTIGKIEDGVFDHNVVDGGLQIQYDTIGEENRTAIILLFCNDTEGNFIVKGEEPADSGKYYFELYSKHICGGPDTTINPSQPTTPATTTENTSNQPHPIIDVCVQRSPCSCQYSNGDIIDLMAISNSDSSNPRFKDMPAEGLGRALYSWNPCYPFTEGETCKDVALCEIISGAPEKSYIPIGKQDDAVFDHDVKTGDLQLQYSITGTENRTAYIILLCNQYEDGQFIVKGEEPANSGQYYFTLESKHVCRSSPSNNNGLTAGSIILIIIAVLVGVYLIGGMAYQKCVNNASGKEIIPNYHFWAGIGNAIKNGVVYVFTCGRSEYTEIDSPSEKTPIQSQP